MGIGIGICITKSIDNGYLYRCMYAYAIYCCFLLFMYISIGIGNGYWYMYGNWYLYRYW